jgi:tyrosyl-tRNA synthetase
LGHSVVLRILKVFQELGHEIIFVIGDFTGMIGDPTGKSKTRPSLSLEETRKSGETYFKQVTRILDPLRTNIVYNSEWLNKMNFSDVIKLAGKYTLARILEREDFSNRYTNNKPIGVHEILYPLVQGYDSVHLQADIEVGGTDQTFNLLVGRELQKDYGFELQEVITFPLLPGLDGVEKMSKSLDNYIGINEPAHRMFEKCMKVPDSILLDYFRLTTDYDTKIAKELMEKDIRMAHFEYAKEIVTLYHSAEDALNAEKKYREIAKNAIPSELNEIKIEFSEGISLIEVIRKLNFANSNSEARKLISGRGIKIDNVVIEDLAYKFANRDSVVICKGKSNFVRVVFD